jgi:hypothetical protein
VLAAYHVPEKIIRLLKNLHDGTVSCVRMYGQESECFETRTGVRQGCIIAPLLFNVFLDCIVRIALERMPGDSGVFVYYKIDGHLVRMPKDRLRECARIPLLLYADDIVLFATSFDDLKRMLHALETVARSFGMTISAEKTKIMSVGKELSDLERYQKDYEGWELDDAEIQYHTQCFQEMGKSEEELVAYLQERIEDIRSGVYFDTYDDPADPKPEDISVGGVLLEHVKEFKYLGSTVCVSNDLEVEINSRVAQAAFVFGQLRVLWKAEHVSLQTKGKVYKAIVLPTLLYGSESWAPTKKHTQKLHVAHMKFLRFIMGITRASRVPNADVLLALRVEDVEVVMRRTRLRWLGHVGRMSDSRVPKQLVFGKLPGDVLPGHKMQSWGHVVMQDLKSIVGFRAGSWYRDCKDRPKWRHMISKGQPERARSSRSRSSA